MTLNDEVKAYNRKMTIHTLAQEKAREARNKVLAENPSVFTRVFLDVKGFYRKAQAEYDRVYYEEKNRLEALE